MYLKLGSLVVFLDQQNISKIISFELSYNDGKFLPYIPIGSHKVHLLLQAFAKLHISILHLINATVNHLIG